MLELITKVININPAAKHPILQASHSLYEYSCFIQAIRDHIDAGLTRDEAIVLAMEECTRQGIMLDFIKEHGTEVRNLLFTEFNMEDALEVCGEENFEKGVQTGIQTGLRGMIETCQELGVSKEDTLLKVLEKFQLERDSALSYIEQYWQEKSLPTT